MQQRAGTFNTNMLTMLSALATHGLDQSELTDFEGLHQGAPNPRVWYLYASVMWS